MGYLAEMNKISIGVLLCWGLLGGGLTGSPAEEPDAALQSSLDAQAIRLLQNKCVNCHGAETAEGNLRLDSRELMVLGGDRGEVLRVGKPRESLLWQSIAGANESLEMPPKDPLRPAEIALIEGWISRGAHWPESVFPQPSSPLEGAIDGEQVGNAWNDPRNPIARKFGGERLSLWSLQPVKRPDLPRITNADWPMNDLDRFVLARLEVLGVAAPARADRHTMVRRLHFDLIGLPPSPEDASRFETQDGDDPQLIAQLVDQLLESEQFGQHWARLWLDVVRYSDSNGFDWDEFRPQAWRYRDYVIRSFNSNKRFDQFVLEQLAGDELVAGQPQNAEEQDALIATGFLRLGPHDNAAGLFNEQDRSRDELLTDLVETTGNAFLGITLSCCRCHDHKHDPFSQADHFRLRACFAGVEFADSFAIDTVSELQRIEAHNAEIDERIAQLNSQKATILAASDDQTQAQEEFDASVRQLEQERRTVTHALLMMEKQQEIPETFVLFQGDYKSPRERVEPGVLSIFDPNKLTSATTKREGSSGRRLALARWITAVDNPLTARVFVNRVWQQLMGRGLVATAGDFGLAGEPPHEPELLDWLASRFVEEGWSMKWLIRTIVLSSTYQQQPSYDESHIELAHLLRRPRRLTAEQLRDAILATSGLLTAKQSGPPEWPDLPKEVLEANPAFLDDNETKTKGWYPSPLEHQHCRSIFLVQKRNTRVPFLETFDQPENSVSCTRRLSSVVAPQALSLMNGPEALRAAERFADRVKASSIDEKARLTTAFQLAYQREPSLSEAQACLQQIPRIGWIGICRALLNTNEFAYVD